MNSKTPVTQIRQSKPEIISANGKSGVPKHLRKTNNMKE